MRVGIPKETAAGEHRVAPVPDVIRRPAAEEFQITVGPGAGADAMLPDVLSSPSDAPSSMTGDRPC